MITALRLCFQRFPAKPDCKTKKTTNSKLFSFINTSTKPLKKNNETLARLFKVTVGLVKIDPSVIGLYSRSFNAFLMGTRFLETEN